MDIEKKSYDEIRTAEEARRQQELSSWKTKINISRAFIKTSNNSRNNEFQYFIYFIFQSFIKTYKSENQKRKIWAGWGSNPCGHTTIRS